MRGIILAGGTGSRHPTPQIGASKQLMPVYDKPMIYYPYRPHARSDPRDLHHHDSADMELHRSRRRLPVGRRVQLRDPGQPDGLAQAFVIGETLGNPSHWSWATTSSTARPWVLNSTTVARTRGGAVFAYRVPDPEAYGVVEFDSSRQSCLPRGETRAPRSN